MPSNASGADAAVLVGRFQPFHRAHLALLREALAIAPRCIVVLGSAHHARTPKDPFTWEERAATIRLALPEAERQRVRFLPVRDYYDEARWARAVSDGVEALLAQDGIPDAGSIALVGRVEDAGSACLAAFPRWRRHAIECIDSDSGASLRDALFGGGADAPGHALAALADQVPPSTLDFLRAWCALPFFADLAQEWRMLREYKDAWKSAPYPPVFVTVDAIVRCADRVLLIRRGRAPGRGLHAVPGGFIEPRETLWRSCLRELVEETHLELPEETMRAALREVAVFDHPDRSQRGRIITHAHYFDFGDREPPQVRADDDAQSVEWVPIESLASMEDRFHDDHFHILDRFLGLIDGLIEGDGARRRTTP